MFLRSFLSYTLIASSAVAWSAAPPCKDGVSLFPAPGSVVPTNTQFIIEGVGAAQDKVRSLLESNGLALVAPGYDTVAVKAEKGFISMHSRVAVRLRPLQTLQPHVKYTLALPAALTGARLLNDSSTDGQLRWLTAAGPDTQAPVFRTRPSSSEGLYRKGVDGKVTTQLRLRATIDEQSMAWALVTLERARGSSARQQYPVPLDGNSFLIGHDGCSGSFGFDEGRAYKVSVELFDVAGNRASRTHRFQVSAPHQ